MDRLIADCQLTCPADGQIKVLERCLQYLQSCGDNFTKKEVGWLLLAKILERCNAECLRAGQSRLGKRLGDVLNNVSLPSAIFVRQLLVRNPQTGELHASIVEKIVLSLLDTAVRDQDEELKEIAAEIFSLRYGCSKSPILLQTLEALLRERLIGSEDRQGLLNISCLGMTQYQVPLTQYLFDLLSYSFAYSKQGELLERDRFLAVVEAGLKNEKVRDSTLRALSAFCNNAKSAALPVVPLIVSMLVSQLSSPSSELFSTLEQISNRFGTASTLHKHLFVIFGAMNHPLDEQDYGKAAGALLSSVIRNSSFLVQPEILLVIQKSICNQCARDPSSSIYRSILHSLLFSTHPLVPVPVHIARTVVQRFPDEALSSVCDTICRPRLLNLDTRRVLEKAVSVKLNDLSAAVVVPKEEEMEQEGNTIDQYKQEVNKVMEEIRATTAKEDGKRDEEEANEEDRPTTSKEKTVQEPKKRPTPAGTSSAPKKKAKKTSATAVEAPKTVLQAGEESVDDILDSFCVD